MAELAAEGTTTGGGAPGGIDVDWEALRRTHRRLSPEAVHFLEFARREPRALDPASFELLERENPDRISTLQPWPTLVSAQQVAHFSRVNAVLARLVRDAPSRLLDGDPARLAEVYGLDLPQAGLLAQVLANHEFRDSLIGRGDFILGPAGFHCVEYNMAGGIGGLDFDLCEALYRRVPVLRQFMEEEGVDFKVARSATALWNHLLDHARRRRRGEIGSFHLAIAVPPDQEVSPPAREHVSRELQRVLDEREPGALGEVFVCDYGDLQLRNNQPHLGDRRIDAIVSFGARITREVFFAWMDGQVDLYNGPVDQLVLPDKRTLALISQAADDGELDEEETRIVQAHVPWTRRVEPVFTQFRGEAAPLPEIVRSAREDLVLKPGMGWGGKGVQLGAFASQESWDRLVDEAVETGAWVVQERVRSYRFLFHTGTDEGARLQDVVWGFFNWGGSEFHGGHVRMVAESDGVVNLSRGATRGLIFVVPGTDAGPDGP